MTEGRVSLGAWLTKAEYRLAQAGVESPRLEAQVLAAHALGESRSWVVTHTEELVDPWVFGWSLWRRAGREPLAYIVGEREFYGRPFAVDRNTLVPRADTEVVLEEAVDVADTIATGQGDLAVDVLDVGTGSGVLAVSLKLERPWLQVTGCDVSAGALTVAWVNGELLGAEVAWVESDMFANIDGEFDLIVSNPPYVATASALEPEVALHEPASALFAKEEGMEFYRRLAKESLGHIRPGGQMVVELGDFMLGPAQLLFEDHGWEVVAFRKDLTGMPRALTLAPPAGGPLHSSGPGN
ncbi:MAG: peptide chain release factor N(5)-glutamine methyltransferase [Fimbriimonadaceae bacterium]|nr:peptide chain release factor N(5)-glutamine methyltransferase [Fimbriimonadaceae bacterium]